MGYESRLYVINKSTLTEDINGKKMYWAEVVATFNLCVAGTVIEMCEYPETDAYFYDGNTLVTEDKYGEPLKEVPVKDAIEIISKAANKGTCYTYSLKTMITNFNNCLLKFIACRDDVINSIINEGEENEEK